ncbi:hypothetical protein [Dactylosporangium sp. NPDC006015]|uniref:hypothetical protein n=1 Tax=Dactylosporangium sp. NPDC006015 TaxID=3154576 RepID=UPI0033ADC748
MDVIEVLRERVGTFRRLAVEHGIPVVIGAPEPLPRNPGLPGGLYDVFDLVGSVDTGDLRFAPPAEVRTVEAWWDRVVDEECPLGGPPAIGEGYVVTGDTEDDVIVIGDLSLDVADGSVYYIDGDSYRFYCIDGAGLEEIEVDEFAPDLPTFFTRYVFGPGYPRLAATVCNLRAYQTRKHRYVAPWMTNSREAHPLIPPPGRETGRMETWFDHAAAEAAEARGDWTTAIAVVSEFAECYSQDFHRHNAHLWHMDLLARAGLLDELADQAGVDVHARRRLDRLLFEEGRAGELRRRAEDGDKTALHLLVRLLRAQGQRAAAVRAAADIDADRKRA